MTLTIPEGLAVFLLAAAFDILIGEPPVRIHPVVWIGRLISSLRSLARPSMMQGILLAMIVIAVSVLSAHLLVEGARAFPVLPLLVGAYLLKSTFAIRCLLETSSSIGRMVGQDIEEAKKMLPALVGRETGSLSPAQASSAVIESLSENYVDSILTPIFYYVLLSPRPGAGGGHGLQGHKHHGLDDRLQEARSEGAGLCWSEAGRSGQLDSCPHEPHPDRPGQARRRPGCHQRSLEIPSCHPQPQLRLAHGRSRRQPEDPAGEARSVCTAGGESRAGAGDIHRATALMQSAIALTMLAAIILLFLYSS